MIAIGNHLWHCTLFAAIAALITIVLRPYQAKVRFWIWFAASVKFLLPFSVLAGFGARAVHSLDAERRVHATPVSPVAMRVAQPFGPEAAMIPETQVTDAKRDGATAGVVAIWFSGCLLIARRRYREWLMLRSALLSSTASPIKAEIPVRSSPVLVEPSVVGWLRPVLLLPDGVASTLTGTQLDAVLVHEVSHVRRKDNVLALFHMLVEFLFWFHPLVWWIGAQLAAERERACDEEVLRRGTDPRVYAEGILAVCRSYTRLPFIAASGVTGWSIKQRIEEIMMNDRSRDLGRLRTAGLVAAGGCVLALPVVTGIFNAPLLMAQPASLRFQSVTVRPCSDLPNARRGTPYVASGGVLRTGCLPLADEHGLGLIQRAYVRFNANGGSNWPTMLPVEGKPAWFGTDLYEIVGTAERNTPQATMEGPMLRAALEERFQLKLHEESVRAAVYELKAAFGGPKVSAFQAASCTPLRASLPLPPLADGQRYCIVRTGIQPPAIDAEGVSLGELATLLSLVVDRPVIDRTSIADRFTVHLAFTPDSTTPRFLAGGELARFASAPPPGTPTILPALEQLGLRLEPGSGTQRQLVIDHVQKPAGD